MMRRTVILMITTLLISYMTGIAAPSGPIKNIEYAQAGSTNLLLDIYPAAQTGKAAPVIVWIHGGGWRNGSKDKFPGSFLVTNGFAVVSINYRLSPQAPYPAQLEDCKAAIRWIRANAEKYQLDPTRIAAWGASAGGHLAAMLGLTGQDRQFDKGNNLDQSSEVQAVCDWSGPADLLEMDRTIGKVSDIQHTSLTMLLNGPPEENTEKAALASPVTWISRAKKIPPFLIVHGDEDQSVPFAQSQMLCADLEKANADVQFHRVKGAGHGLAKYSQEIRPLTVQFFCEKLK